MNLRRFACCLILALGLLPSGIFGAFAQVDTLPTRFYLLPYSQQTYDSTYNQRLILRYWLLRYTQRNYEEGENGTFRLSSKARASWFFGRVSRQTDYYPNGKRARVYRYRRNLYPKVHRPTWRAHAEFLTVERRFQEDGKVDKVVRYRDGYYLFKQRSSNEKMPRFYRKNYRGDLKE
ncbi:hypothetical protein [Hymenobacter negativus]|uniref:hypothetical protein n=1 Tax=Hymenobacter negativus TaxID=2795026 RepID=UPI0018DD09C7|nr:MULTISPECIES: hypothetical protein [Bacteria]MBH8567999.1 hypothetical protein [Hymenobacter negativus]MBR7207735.1 hypothetical protein [Microvirga sp. STS02]